MNRRTIITAHSGADKRPDNSLEFVRYALESTADALEVDIQKDPASGELIITHDRDLSGQYPRLREVFALLAQHPAMRINCDLKPAGLEWPVYQLAEEMGVTERLIYSGTVDVKTMKSRPQLVGVEVFLNLEEYVENLYVNYRDIPNFELTAAETICRVCKENGVRVVNVNYNLVTRRFIELLAAEGIGVSVWTVNDSEAIRYFLARGAYNVTTRSLAQALQLRSE